MPKRTCDVCGKSKEVKGGQVCEKSHFVCSQCSNMGGLLGGKRKQCPICKTKLR